VKASGSGARGTPAAAARRPAAKRAVVKRDVERSAPVAGVGLSHPEKVYFPSSGLQMDRYGSIRSSFLLDEGMVYSVESQVPVVPTPLLRPGTFFRQQWRPERQASWRQN
jgi:hypothetical protein